MPSSAPRPRPMGGFNQGLGNFSDEHLSENDLQQAMGQKALGQQAAQATGQGGLPAQLPGQTSQGTGQPAQPREVGSLADELIRRPAQDIVKGLQSLFDLKTILGLKSGDTDPQTLMKKKQMIQRFNQMTEEEQAYARQKYQQELQRKQQEEQERQMKAQQEAQQKAQSVEMPSGPQKGPAGPGAKKPKAVQRLEDNRKQLSGPQSAN